MPRNPGLLASLLVATLVTPAVGQTPVVSYQFTGQPGNQSGTAPTTVAPAVTATSITRASGLSAVAGADSFGSTGFTNSDITGARDAADFITFSVSITSPSQSGLTGFDFDSLSYTVQREATAPRTLELFAFFNGTLTGSLGTRTVTTTAAETLTFDLNGLDAQTRTVAGPIEFRLYGYDVNGGTSGALRLVDPVGGSGVVLTGTPVPEPTLVLGCAAVGLATLAGVRRRRLVA